MTADLPHGGEGWLHPGWASRQAHLRAVQTRPVYARAFAGRLRLLTWLGLLLHAAAIACLVLPTT